MRWLLRACARLTVGFVVFALVWAVGFAWFLAQIPSAPAVSAQKTDAIVVLTGGKGRIDYGVKLLADAMAARMFISGVGEDTTAEEILSRTKTDSAASAGNIILGHAAVSTIGNAAEAADWMRENNFRSLRLVTASYHMPRSLVEFRHALPDAAIIPDPVFSGSFDKRRWYARPSAAIALIEYHKFLAAIARHGLLNLLGQHA